jgi:hypothetical protein
MWRLFNHIWFLVASLVSKGSSQENTPAPQGQFRCNIHIYQLSQVCDNNTELLCFNCHVCNQKNNNDPHPVILCVTDNTSALNWTRHTSNRSIVGRALARFFCGFLIGSKLGVNAKWISTIKNMIADKISRLKLLNVANSKSPSSSPTYDYSNLQQEHKELRACDFFQLSHKLVLLLWDILLMHKCPDLSLIMSLKLQDLGRLCT